MLTCNDANVLIVRTLDDAPSGGERAALRRHLGACARCRCEYETQHDVRRLLALHIQDRLPEGFDARLSARLARTSRPLPAPAPRWMEVDAARRRDTRVRTWALRLIPLAATVALIVAGSAVRDVSPRPAVSSGAGSSDAPSGRPAPRAFTTVVLPRPDRTSRRHQPSPALPASTEDVALAPAQPVVDDGQRHAIEAVAESGARDRVTAPEPRVEERQRVAGRESNASGERASDVRVDDERADAERTDAERAASQRPGILPRPPAPIPQARPAIPPL
jgi:hypothetical protein